MRRWRSFRVHSDKESRRRNAVLEHLGISQRCTLIGLLDSDRGRMLVDYVVEPRHEREIVALSAQQEWERVGY
jgi:hypothetical protein